MKAAFGFGGKDSFLELNLKEKQAPEESILDLAFLMNSFFFFFSCFNCLKHNSLAYPERKSQSGCQTSKMYPYIWIFMNLLIFMDELGL